MLAVEVSELDQKQPPESRSPFECLVSRITGHPGSKTNSSGFRVSQEFRANMQDPSLVEGSEEGKKRVFRYVRDEIKARVRQFVQETGNQ
jgi:hypothetical protein